MWAPLRIRPFRDLNKPEQVEIPQPNPPGEPDFPRKSQPGKCAQLSWVRGFPGRFPFLDPFENVSRWGWGRSVQTRHHLGPERIPAEGLCRAVLEVPRGQRNDHFSKEHPPGECAQVPHGHLQPPGHQLGRLHLVLQGGTETVSLGSRGRTPRPPGPPSRGLSGSADGCPEERSVRIGFESLSCHVALFSNLAEDGSSTRNLTPASCPACCEPPVC